jgi:hypothetical protein
MERGGAENEELADDILMRSCALRVFRASAIINQKLRYPPTIAKESSLVTLTLRVFSDTLGRAALEFYLQKV